MQISALSRIPGVLVAPRRTFAAIAERPTVLVALVLATLVGAGVVHAGFGKVAPQELLRSVEESGRALPPQLDAARLHRISHWSAVGGAIVMPPLAVLLTAGLFLGGVRLAGGELDYRRALSVTVHGLLPFTLAGLLTLPVILARESIGLAEVQGGSVLLSHLGAFAPESAGPVLTALLTSVDLFSVWCIALLVLGFEVVGRVSRRASAVAVGLVWGLGVLLKVGAAALR